MADDRETVDPQIEADLALIREALGEGATDDQAAAVAIQTLGDHLANGRLVLTPADLQRLMLGYAQHVLSQVIGRTVEVLAGPNGEFVFTADGEPLAGVAGPDATRAPMH